jgi:hypothetical protein
MLRFPPKIIFLEINRVNNIITWKRRRFAGPRLLDRSPQPLCWHRTRLPSESGRSWEKLFLCNAVASASPTPPGKRSRRGVTLHRQNLTPLPNINGEQTLDLKCKTPDFHRKPESLYHRDSPWISGYRVQNVSQNDTQSHTSHHIKLVVQ